MSEYPSMYDAAIEYAKKGFAVFPLKYRDKVPLTRNGCKDATTDAAQIKAWWQKYPNANIGLATGSVSQNVFVIDLDIDEDRGIDGYHSLEDWQREHGDFPETWTAITGRGGYHLYYRGNGKIKNRAGIIDGVDIRGNGGYVVAPPSIHKNGNRYEWEYSPDEFEIAKADNNVEYFLNHDDHRQSASFTMPNIVSAGQRNQMLFRFACMMQAKGASDQSVFAATMAENESSCSPPLTEQEVRIIVSSATKYDKGKPIHIDSEGVATRENKDDVIGNPEWVLSFLDCNHDKDGNIKSVKQFVHNFEIVMDKDDRFAGKIRFNEFAQQLYLCGNVPWEKEDNSLSGIENAFTFSYDVTTPDGKRRWGKYSMNLPRVNTVPYLAKGAVIPPRSEFLAVLGDQKQGNNIETPEALLRKIVREETAGRQAGGGSYRFTAQINRRTLFDEMMKEAQMRRDTSGRNPFEMA